MAAEGKGGLLAALAGKKPAGPEEEAESEPAEETPKSAAASAVMSALQADDREAFEDALTTFIQNCR